MTRERTRTYKRILSGLLAFIVAITGLNLDFFGGIVPAEAAINTAATGSNTAMPSNINDLILAEAKARLGRPYKGGVGSVGSPSFDVENTLCYDCSNYVFWSMRGAGFTNVPKYPGGSSGATDSFYTLATTGKFNGKQMQYNGVSVPTIVCTTIADFYNAINNSAYDGYCITCSDAHYLKDFYDYSTTYNKTQGNLLKPGMIIASAGNHTAIVAGLGVGRTTSSSNSTNDLKAIGYAVYNKIEADGGLPDTHQYPIVQVLGSTGYNLDKFKQVASLGSYNPGYNCTRLEISDYPSTSGQDVPQLIRYEASRADTGTKISVQYSLNNSGANGTTVSYPATLIYFRGKTANYYQYAIAQFNKLEAVSASQSANVSGTVTPVSGATYAVVRNDISYDNIRTSARAAWTATSSDNAIDAFVKGLSDTDKAKVYGVFTSPASGYTRVSGIAYTNGKYSRAGVPVVIYGGYGGQVDIPVRIVEIWSPNGYAYDDNIYSTKWRTVGYTSKLAQASASNILNNNDSTTAYKPVTVSATNYDAVAKATLPVLVACQNSKGSTETTNGYIGVEGSGWGTQYDVSGNKNVAVASSRTALTTNTDYSHTRQGYDSTTTALSYSFANAKYYTFNLNGIKYNDIGTPIDGATYHVQAGAMTGDPVSNVWDFTTGARKTVTAGTRFNINSVSVGSTTSPLFGGSSTNRVYSFSNTVAVSVYENTAPASVTKDNGVYIFTLTGVLGTTSETGAGTKINAKRYYPSKTSTTFTNLGSSQNKVYSSTNGYVGWTTGDATADFVDSNTYIRLNLEKRGKSDPSKTVSGATFVVTTSQAAAKAVVASESNVDVSSVSGAIMSGTYNNSANTALTVINAADKGRNDYTYKLPTAASTFTAYLVETTAPGSYEKDPYYYKLTFNTTPDNTGEGCTLASVEIFNKNGASQGTLTKSGQIGYTNNWYVYNNKAATTVTFVPNATTYADRVMSVNSGNTSDLVPIFWMVETDKEYVGTLSIRKVSGTEENKTANVTANVVETGTNLTSRQLTASFGVYNQPSCTDASLVTTLSFTGTKSLDVSTLQGYTGAVSTSNTSGSVYLPSGSLNKKATWYYKDGDGVKIFFVKETSVQSGYALDDTVWQVTVFPRGSFTENQKTVWRVYKAPTNEPYNTIKSRAVGSTFYGDNSNIVFYPDFLHYDGTANRFTNYYNGSGYRYQYFFIDNYETYSRDVYYGRFGVAKKDQQTGAFVNGIVFDRYTNANCTGTPVESKATITYNGQKGIAVFDVGEMGSQTQVYYIRENRASAEALGYNWNSTIFTVTVTGGKITLTSSSQQPTAAQIEAAKQACSVTVAGKTSSGTQAVSTTKTTDSTKVAYFTQVNSRTVLQGDLGAVKYFMDGNTKVYVSGVTFTIYSDSDCNNSVGTMMTDGNGIAYKDISNIPGVWYKTDGETRTFYIKETSVTGAKRTDTNTAISLVLDSDTITEAVVTGADSAANSSVVYSGNASTTTITIDDHDLLAFEQENVQNTLLGYFGVLKLDEETKLPVKGIKFNICYQSNYAVDGNGVLHKDLTITSKSTGIASLNVSTRTDGVIPAGSWTGSMGATKTYYIQEDRATALANSYKWNPAIIKVVVTGVESGTTFPAAYYIDDTAVALGDGLTNGTYKTYVTGGKTYMLYVETNTPERNLKVSKVDNETDKEIAGATLTLYTTKVKSGKRIKDAIYATWVSGEDGTDTNGDVIPHILYDIPIGWYILSETSAPTDHGFTTTSDSEPFEVTDAKGLQTAPVMRDEHTELVISKTDLVTGAEVAGATLELIDAGGTSVMTWKSGSTTCTLNFPNPEAKAVVEVENNITKLYLDYLPVGTYTLRETTAPKGYKIANDIQVTITDSSAPVAVDMKDEPISVHFGKYDLNYNTNISGAGFTLYRAKKVDGVYVKNGVWQDFITPVEGVITIDYIYAGTYILSETTVPDGLLNPASDFIFSVNSNGVVKKISGDGVVSGTTVNVYNAPPKGKVEIYKTGIKTGDAVEGAVFTIYDEAGTAVDELITNGDGYAISNIELEAYRIMPDGNRVDRRYTMRETAVSAKGVMLTTEVFDITFTFVDGDTPIITNTYTITDDETWIAITKVDDDGTPIAGATLAVYEADKNGKPTGSVIDRWTSTAEKHDLYRLDSTKRYVLVEEDAPDDYLLSEPVVFTVKKVSDMQAITMTDLPMPKLPTAGGMSDLYVRLMAILMLFGGICLVKKKKPNQ